MVRFRQGAVPEQGRRHRAPVLRRKRKELGRGQKAGFFFLGFLGGIVGILAASLMNINAPYRPEGTKMAALGFATACVLGTLIALVGFIALLGAR